MGLLILQVLLALAATLLGGSSALADEQGDLIAPSCATIEHHVCFRDPRSTYGFPAVAAAPECCAACLADARCSAWTYINGPSSPSRCHLKTAGLNRTVCNNGVSSVLRPPSPSPSPSPGPGPGPSPPAFPPAECKPANLPMGAAHGGHAQIRGPADLSAVGLAAWGKAMNRMRVACNNATGFDADAPDSIYNDHSLKWTQTAYMGPQMHPYDRFFYDPALGNGTGGAGYTVDKWLADLNARYGGIDQALIWPTYTNIGIDDRNQFDMIRSLPGGAEGIKVVVEQLHARGVKVLWPYNPWDSSTLGSERNNETDIPAMAELMRDTGADGFNGDTMGHIPQAFSDANVKLNGRPLAMQAEGGLSAGDIKFRTIGWAEGYSANESLAGNDMPNVDKAKWLSFGKATTQWCARWTGSPWVNRSSGAPEARFEDRIGQLQVQFFNGLGYSTWENVWGSWNAIIERDGEAIRRIALMLRYFGARGFMQSSEWAPHTPEVLQMSDGVYGSAFPLGAATGETVWTLVNRNDAARSGAQLLPVVQGTASRPLHFFDCYRGVPLTPNRDGELSFTIAANGFGCVLATPNATVASSPPPSAEALRLTGGAPAVPATLGDFLAAMASLTAQPLAAFDGSWHYLNQTMVNADTKTAPLRPLHSAKPGEVFVPSSTSKLMGMPFHFVAAGVELEGTEGSGVGEQFPWEAHPQKAHDHLLHVGPMYVDTFPVTNAKYAVYLNATKYVPSDTTNWLKQSFDFAPDGAPVAPKRGWATKPVTYVALADARAYCAHEGKRLPHTHEWQYFAQGGVTGRHFPWGNTDNASLTPAVDNSYVNPGPEPVGQYPGGASPFGVQDLVRNVWQMTTEFRDAHTRSLILRGGSRYGPWRGKSCRWIENDDGTPRTIAPACYETAMRTPVPGSTPHPRGGSHWYFPPAFDLATYNKYFIMGGSYERAGTIGFRCVADAEDDSPAPALDGASGASAA